MLSPELAPRALVVVDRLLARERDVVAQRIEQCRVGDDGRRQRARRARERDDTVAHERALPELVGDLGVGFDESRDEGARGPGIRGPVDGIDELGRVGQPNTVGHPGSVAYPARMPRLRVAAAQLNLVVGDVEGNAAHILEVYDRAEAEGCDLVAFPELAITGYPPEDLLLRAVIRR